MSTVKSKKLQVGTDASASNNFTIYQPAVPDGTLRVGVGNADSPTEVGRFNANGYKPAVAPAFRAKPSSNQTISASTFTKVLLQTEIFDTNNNFDNSTNYRFQPTVAGYYQVNSQIHYATNGQQLVAVYKNGSYDNWGTYSVNAYGVSGSSLIYLNGSTDYLELYAYSSGGYSVNSGLTFLSAHLIQQA